MQRFSNFLKKTIALMPVGSTFLLVLLVKTGAVTIDPNILAKTTP